MAPLVDATTLESSSEIEIPILTDNGADAAASPLADATYAPVEPDTPAVVPTAALPLKRPVYGREVAPAVRRLLAPGATSPS